MNHEWEKWDTTPIERVHTQFLKRVLGVNRSTTNVMVRAELGRHSIQERILKRNLQYIDYVSNKEPSSLVHQALIYEESFKDARPTIFSLFQKHDSLSEICQEEDPESGLGAQTTFEKINALVSPKLQENIRTLFNLNWKTQSQTFVKSSLFSEFKNSPKFDPYLSQIQNRKHRISFTKLRLSDHILMIEEGRHHRPLTPRDERFCPHCQDCIEDEIHFLTQCAAYDRTELFEKFTADCPNFAQMDDKNKFLFMMTQEGLELTKFLIEKTHSWSMQRLEFKKQQHEMVRYVIVLAPIE